jgi:predicted flavoprotein YhiN
LSREGRKRLAVLLEGLPLTIVGREKGTEMVTAGGVRLEEIDPRTMGSRVVPGLFFCGEVLDIDGFTGGYNLQAAWSTGRIAGLAAGR